MVKRLPPGPDACGTDADRSDLNCFVLAIEQVLEMDRSAVRAAAASELSTDACIAKVLNALQSARESVLAAAG
jgi:hypothetical protein